jgi:YfiH family protein
MPSEAGLGWLSAEGLPEEVSGLMSSRSGGVSQGPWRGLNLQNPSPGSEALQDSEAHVAENRRRFEQALHGARPVYLKQVHGVRVVRLTAGRVAAMALRPVEADAAVCVEPGLACTVMVADCLPVLFAAPAGRGVGAAHAGWRGMSAGVLEATVARLCRLADCEPDELVAWLGACIGPTCFEVGEEVVAAFGAEAKVHFRPGAMPGKWMGDLAGLAAQRLARVGVERLGGGGWCTVSAPSDFFSFRRDRVTGRHAAAIWIR